MLQREVRMGRRLSAPKGRSACRSATLTVFNLCSHAYLIVLTPISANEAIHQMNKSDWWKVQMGKYLK